ncbi:hypothetical protein MTAT_19850 [Moorella thermoacetica]|uniref:Uncharacterized protein n=1 Tax=Neomoorella thermoacetica TaxID=1525 RepID=A0AAC9HIR0_NEOTH|nr:hypothetical protein [Moorella thermoacetica]AOQ24640.1 hypothetical protein Maut_02212 [Moorella thermoacetica]TYL12743.1 hypothetical protein MTAT_19850 [Moorella thermoacetica]
MPIAKIYLKNGNIIEAPVHTFRYDNEKCCFEYSILDTYEDQLVYFNTNDVSAVMLCYSGEEKKVKSNNNKENN